MKRIFFLLFLITPMLVFGQREKTVRTDNLRVKKDFTLGAETRTEFQQVYRQNDEPGGTLHEGDVWIDLDDEVTYVYDGSAFQEMSSSAGSGISGLTTNYLTKAIAADDIGNSQVFDNGTNVGIGTASPEQKLHLAGEHQHGQKIYIDDVITNIAGTGALLIETGIDKTVTSTIYLKIEIHGFNTNNTAESRLSGTLTATFRIQPGDIINNSLLLVNGLTDVSFSLEGQIGYRNSDGTIVIFFGDPAAAGANFPWRFSSIDFSEDYTAAGVTFDKDNVGFSRATSTTGFTIVQSMEVRSYDFYAGARAGDAAFNDDVIGAVFYNNNVGGTTNTASLHIIADAPPNSPDPQGVTNGVILRAHKGGHFAFLTPNSSGGENPTEKMRITGGGNVGIGTTSPASKLHVNGNLQLNESGSGITTPEFQFYGTGSNYRLIFRDISQVSDNWFGLSSQEASTNWYTASDAYSLQSHTGTELMRIGNSNGNSYFTSSAGNVGIGTTSPDEELHVVGSIKMVDGNQAAGKYLTSDADGVASWAAITSFIDGGNSLAATATLGTNDNHSLVFETVNTERMRLQTNGVADFTSATGAGTSADIVTIDGDLPTTSGVHKRLTIQGGNSNLAGFGTIYEGSAGDFTAALWSTNGGSMNSDAGVEVLSDNTVIMPGSLGIGSDDAEHELHIESSGVTSALLRTTNGAFTTGITFENEADDDFSWFAYRDANGQFVISYSDDQPYSTETDRILEMDGVRTTIGSIATNLDPVSATTAAGLGASDGDILYVNTTDATFTSVGFWGRENGSWVKL